MNDPRVSFITVNYKTPHHVRHLLTGVEDAALGVPFEYFLVDNDSKDGTPSMVRTRFPWTNVIESPDNRGYGAGNNLALVQAKGDYILLCNPDLIIFPREVEGWIEWMDRRPDVAISGPRLLNPDGSDQESCYRFPSLLTPILRRTPLGSIGWFRKLHDRHIMKDMDRRLEQDVDWVLGAAMLIRKSALEKIGGFDERFFMYYEEADICRRAWLAGFRVSYFPEARFMHYHRRESRINNPLEIFTNRLARIHIQSAFKFFFKYFGQPHPRDSSRNPSS